MWKRDCNCTVVQVHRTIEVSGLLREKLLNRTVQKCDRASLGGYEPIISGTFQTEAG